MRIIERLQRKTNSQSFIPEIDGLRFFAIATVVIFHLNTSLSEHLHINWKENLGIASFLDLGWWVLRLDIGVKVFFAISGFILSVPFLKHYLFNGPNVELKSYFYRRLLRLEPPFIITLLGFFLLQVIMGIDNFNNLLPHLLASLFYLHGFIFAAQSSINPVTWSLETEAQFYVLIPFLFFIIFKFRQKVFGILWLLVLLILSFYFRKYIFEHEIGFLKFSILVYLSNFITGILFAWVFLKYKSFFPSKSIYFDLLGIISIFGLFFFYKPQILPKNNFLFNVHIFLLFVSVFKGFLFNWFFTRPWVYTIGGMCYTIYLLHFAFFFFILPRVSFLLPEGNYLLHLIVAFCIAIPMLLIISSLFFILIEKPCMDKNWPNQLMQKLKSNA